MKCPQLSKPEATAARNEICSDRLAVQDCEMHYMNAWLKRCVFNLDLNRESVSEPRTLSGRLFQSLGARYKKVILPLVDFAI